MGGSADTDLQNTLTTDVFDVGFSFTDLARLGSDRYSNLDASTLPRLQVVFTLPEPKSETSTSYIFDATLTQ